MNKDYITFNGSNVRVEANWNAIVAFLEASGRDDMSALAGLDKLKPSDVAGLMAACINEGERLDGHESHLTAVEVGSIGDMKAMLEFIKVYAKQMNPHGTPEESKKKD